MGMDRNTYFAFGAKIAENAYDLDWEKFEPGGLWHPILFTYDVNFLMAGDHDRDKMFLTTFCKQVEYGTYERVNPFSLGSEENEWKFQLQMVADQIGMELLEEPAWFVIPDVS